MEMIALPVLGESDIGHVRRTTQVLAAGLGFDPTGVAELAIAATELATNLVSHAAVEGVITLAAFGDTPSPGIEIVSNDRGPGIADIDLAFSDRTSTRADSMGSGLGAVRRMVDRLDVYSSVGGNGEDGPQGTIIAARKWVDSPPTAAPFDYAMWTRAVSGQTVNGDGAALIEDGAGLLVALADGLGHGPEAATASATAMAVIRRHPDRDFEWLLNRLNGALRRTRGAAIALVRIDPVRRVLVHAAVGNVEMRLHPQPKSHRTARPGIVGTAPVLRFKITELPWPAGASLALYSDGIAMGWGLHETAVRASNRAALMCHLIARDHARATDDASVVVVRDAGD